MVAARVVDVALHVLQVQALVVPAPHQRLATQKKHPSQGFSISAV